VGRGGASVHDKHRATFRRLAEDIKVTTREQALELMRRPHV